MADAAAATAAGASAQTIESEIIDESLAAAAAASAVEAQDNSNALAPSQEAELREGAKELQQAANEEADLDEPEAVAQAHMTGQPTQPRSSQQMEGDTDDEGAAVQPGALEDEAQSTQQSAADTAGAEDAEAAQGEADDQDGMDEDLELDEQDRAQLDAELAELNGAGGDAADEMRYRPHSILDDNDDDDDEEQAAERSRKKKKTSHDRSGAEGAAASFGGDADGEEAPVLTEKEQRVAAINKRIDQALNAGKKKRGRKQENVDDIDIFSDESVKQLKDEMMDAAAKDEDANIAKGLVIEKLKLLPKVMATLQKTHLQQAITDHNLLEGVRRWLEPLPDHSLPALNIQRSFFSVLEKMPIDSISLKMSGLGKLMMFYSMNTKVDPKIRRSADRLIDIWSRPIMKKSSSFRDRALDNDDAEANVQYASQASARETAAPASNAAAARVRIPKTVTGYSVVPRSGVGVGSSSEGPSQNRAKNAAKLRSFKSKLKESKQR